ncbi:uncharacterized protein L969DRAFT_51314 [Mixia osmundae IAM 14324]|uniref:RhoGAP-domain-containing protein n=1 Tax=Mixia osmundae (strain CBS 9802 / IAM 14324 / JCM 22182 / KY 12970) TaxID=764103 RepID=G7E7Z4_MIXOS|nr:uncharacterized protein L969DRAFT_51314 [Mixia osmundae IAM 14324]KEI38553.1 hypothetical protein L969DRAFT_51314 [Mixia osmundae IAM 14324]GAA98954.1 hypothetical protein E5Q_05642 [Mixia osmundae IAM 14324]
MSTAISSRPTRRQSMMAFAQTGLDTSNAGPRRGSSDSQAPSEPTSKSTHLANAITSLEHSHIVHPEELSPTSFSNGMTGAVAPKCGGCQLALEENSENIVVSFGDGLWHLDWLSVPLATSSFSRCAKCGNLVEHDTNLLLLSNGSPVCENCSYICSFCGQGISNEAIVTGDDSYHAECFKCRSCSNKIEELVFAKTSQGIYCMSCHNERVSRSRKHAEQKRQRNLRRQSQSLGPSRESTSQPKYSRTYSDHSSGSSSQPNLAALTSEAPSPKVKTKSSFSSKTNGAPQSSLRPVPGSSGDEASSPGSASSHRALDQTGRFVPHSTGSNHAWQARDISTSSHKYATSASPQPIERSAYFTSASPVQSAIVEAHQKSPPARNASMPSPEVHVRYSSIDEEQDKFDPTQLSGYGNLFDRRVDQEETRNALENGLQSPTLLQAQGSSNKASRRSGFYGHFQPPTTAQTASQSSQDGNNSDSKSADAASSPALTPPPRPKRSSRTNVLPESMSFYDPDMLVFLDAVHSPNSPAKQRIPSQSGVPNGFALPHPIPDSPTSPTQASSAGHERAPDHVEHLSPDPGADGLFGAASGEDSADGGKLGSDTLTRRVRESIRRSRGSMRTGSAEMSVDVTLVEMLLTELEATKEKMKELKANYGAIRRASRTAFEGFNLAQEEYNKEVSARREAQAQMSLLKEEMKSQAARLFKIDEEQKEREALQRQSRELRVDVESVERKLSSLQAEREIAVAEIEELQSDNDRLQLPQAKDRLASSLNERLDEVKNQHRTEVAELRLQRDILQREIAELGQTKTALAEQNNDLRARNMTLLEANTSAQRHLDQAQTTLRRLQDQASTAQQQNGTITPKNRHILVPSISSVSSASTEMSRDGTMVVSSVQTIEPVTATARKFKWGKHKAGADSRSLPAGMRFNSIEVGRQHTLQPTSILRPVKCEHCSDKMWGLQELRCSACGVYCHSKCAPHYNILCNSVSEEPGEASPAPVLFGGDLVVQARKDGSTVPKVVSRCIEAVEAIGMDVEGIYRKTGGSGLVKQITAAFERGEDPDLANQDIFHDVSATTSVLKNYFRALPNPLFTFELNEEILATTDIRPLDAKLEALGRLLRALPEPHFDTAQMLVMHLHRVYQQAQQNKMTPQNLGVVFAPTLLRSEDPNKDFSEMGQKCKVVETLVEHAPKLFS